MAAKRVGRKRGHKAGRKPPLHIVSDFGGQSGGARLGKRARNKMTKSHKSFGAK